MKNTTLFFILKQFFVRFLILAFLVIFKQSTYSKMTDAKSLLCVCSRLDSGIPKIRRLNATLSAFCFTLKASFSSSKTDSKLLLKKFDFLFAFYSRLYRPGGPSYSPGVVTNWLFSTFQIFSKYKIWHF